MGAARESLLRRSELLIAGSIFVLSAACGSTSSAKNDAGDTGNDSGMSNGSDSGTPSSDWPLEPAACGIFAEGTQDADDGATRDFYNRAAGLAFRNELGDWSDAEGVAQVSAPFAVAAVTDNGNTEWQTWDVTTLVQGWAASTWPNKGMLLSSPPGPFNFASREHATAAQHPELVVVTASGTKNYPAAADTYTNRSTYQGFGDGDTLRVGTDFNTLIRFDVDELEGASITSATLRLFKTNDFGGGTKDVAVYRASHGNDRANTAPLEGLSASYPGDANIADHASVMLFADFESASWGDQWTDGSGRATLQAVDGSEGNSFAPLAGSALRIEVTAGDNYGGALTYKFADEQGSEPTEIYMRYYLRFGEDWLPTDGGKLPGISGTYGVAGWGGRPVDGTDGWSARGTYKTVIPDGNPLERHSAIGNYVYHADMAGQYGDVDLWLDGCAGLLDKNRWYAVETYLKLNTLGENDGILRGWVDGRLAYERTNWRWRDVDSLKIEQIWMNVYHGGSAVPPTDLHLYIDNVVIASEYIGPMSK